MTLATILMKSNLKMNEKEAETLAQCGRKSREQEVLESMSLETLQQEINPTPRKSPMASLFFLGREH